MILLIISIISLPLILLYQGFTLCCLWEWFIITAFDLPDLTMISAIGLALTFRFLAANYSKNDISIEDLRDQIALLLTPYAYTTVVLIIGFGVYLVGG